MFLTPRKNRFRTPEKIVSGPLKKSIPEKKQRGFLNFWNSEFWILNNELILVLVRRDGRKGWLAGWLAGWPEFLSFWNFEFWILNIYDLTPSVGHPPSQPASQPASQQASQQASQPAMQLASQPDGQPASQPASQPFFLLAFL